MKNKIVVPVDFSMNALNAYLYARELAKVYNARLDVIHVYLEDSSAGNHTSQVYQSNKAKLKERLDDFVKLRPVDSTDNVLTEVRVKTRLIRGAAIKSIVQASKEKGVNMIVMGARGESDLIDRIIGRVSSEVTQRAYCPVLLVPKDFKYTPFKNILYSSHYKSIDPTLLDRIVAFNKKFDASLHFIHVNNKMKDDKFDKVENKLFSQLFENGDPDFALNIATISSPSVLKGLLQYTEENAIDLIVVVNRQRGFFESMFGESMTKKLALRTPVPILAYHL